MFEIPVTNEGLSEAIAVDGAIALRKGWDILRSLQGNKKASILRYVAADEGKPEVGIPPKEDLVAGLDNLDAYVGIVSIREVIASYGKLELSDMRFVFWGTEVKMTDQILYPPDPNTGKIFDIIQVPFWDPDITVCQVIGRAV